MQHQERNNWRRERDSNPRYGFPHTHFPGVRLQPLGHPVRHRSSRVDRSHRRRRSSSLAATAAVSSMPIRRTPNEPFISRLFRGALSHLDFICRNGHIIGTVLGPSKGSRRRQQSTTDLEGQTTWHGWNLKSLRNLVSLHCDLCRDHLSSSSAPIAAATGSYGIRPGYVVVSLLTVPKRSISPC
jgi:hypothetical protein